MNNKKTIGTTQLLSGGGGGGIKSSKMGVKRLSSKDLQLQKLITYLKRVATIHFIGSMLWNIHFFPSKYFS